MRLLHLCVGIDGLRRLMPAGRFPRDPASAVFSESPKLKGKADFPAQPAAVATNSANLLV
jgi:hypothetical protein